jgi:hypothetical protein
MDSIKIKFEAEQEIAMSPQMKQVKRVKVKKVKESSEKQLLEKRPKRKAIYDSLTKRALPIKVGKKPAKSRILVSETPRKSRKVLVSETPQKNKKLFDLLNIKS